MENNKNETILAKSKSFLPTLEKQYEDSKRKLATGLNSVTIACAFVFLIPYILQIINDEEILDAEPLPVVLYFLIGFMFLFSGIWTFKKQKEMDNNYIKYKNYCSSEVIIVTDNKIYGSTKKGKFELLYSQIEIVKCLNNYYPRLEFDTFLNDVFIIKDIVGNELKFFTIKNGNELKTIIDMQIRSLKNDKVQ